MNLNRRSIFIRIRPALLVALLVTATAYRAFADNALFSPDAAHQGMESLLFRAAIDTKGHFSVDGTNLLPDRKISLSLMLDFGFNGWMAPELKDTDHYNRTVINNFIYSMLLFNWASRT